MVYAVYPVVEGSGCMAKCSSALILPARFENLEEAWEFMEYSLEMASDSKWSSPRRKSSPSSWGRSLRSKRRLSYRAGYKITETRDGGKVARFGVLSA